MVNLNTIIVEEASEEIRRRKSQTPFNENEVLEKNNFVGMFIKGLLAPKIRSDDDDSPLSTLRPGGSI
jgi:hypothetical protein